MIPEVLEWIKAHRQIHFPQPGRVLEIGAYTVNHSARDAFADVADYIGTDMQPGPGVDRVLHGTACLSEFGFESFDTIVCCDTFEHDRTFWRTVDDIHKMLRRGGHLVVSVPGVDFPYHAYPHDYYRFTKDVFRDVFFAGLETLAMETWEAYGGAKGSMIAGIGRKP